MRPDDPVRGDAPLDGFDPGLDGEPELAAIATRLEAAGARARSAAAAGGLERPEPVFAATLRSRLLSALPSASPAHRNGHDHANGTGPADPHDRPVTVASASSHARGIAVPLVRPGALDALRLPGADVAGPVEHAPTPLRAFVRRRTPQVLPAPRWSFLAVAAAVAIAVVSLNSNALFPALPEMRASDVAGATLVRDGTASALTSGAALEIGDEIRVAPDGRATLGFGESLARLEGGASLRIDALSSRHVALEQLGGRVWHRVAQADGGRYEVATGDVRWTATGTAFDLSRAPDPDGGETVHERSIQHDVVVEGPDFRATIEEGRAATVRLGGIADLRTGAVEPRSLTDAWMVANARKDRALGFPIGIMAGVDLALASPQPEPTPTRTSSASLEPTPGATPTTAAPPPPPAPTPGPTPKPTIKPTPTPVPTPGTLSLSLTSCDGGIVLTWSKYAGDGFNHYTALRNTSAEIPLAYPPIGGAVDFGTTYTADPVKVESYDASAEAGGTFYYRAMAFDAEDRVIAASPVKSAVAKARLALGLLEVTDVGGGITNFGWTPYGGPGACFTYYKLAYSADDPTPSYLEGSPYLAAIGTQGAAGYAAGADALTSGTTYWFRLQAIRVTSLGKFLVAETDVTQYSVP